MSTSTTPAILPKPKSRCRWYWIGGFVLLAFMTPFLVSLIAGWRGERRMQALYAEIETDDPDWRWHALCAKIQPWPGDANSAEQIAKVHALLASKSFNLPPNWYNAPNQTALAYRNSQLNQEQAQTLRNAFGILDPTALAEARKLKDMPNGRFAFPAAENPFTMRMDHVPFVLLLFAPPRLPGNTLSATMFSRPAAGSSEDTWAARVGTCKIAKKVYRHLPAASLRQKFHREIRPASQSVS
jgi:hypothetical protein